MTVCPAPNCTGRLVDGECNRCGAMAPKRRTKPGPTLDGRCEHQHHGERCQLPGTIQDSKGSPAYCRHHASEDGRRHGRAQDEFYAQMATPGWVEAQLAARSRSGPQEMVAEMAARPEMRPRPGESTEQYVARIRVSARQAAREFLDRSREHATVEGVKE